MLPRAAYVDPAVFGWEQRHFFGGGWLCVARSEQLPQPGDQRAEATGEGSVLLVRGEDGELRAFANSCRHRGHELLPCGQGAQGTVDHLPVPRLDVRARRVAAGRRGVQEAARLRLRRSGAWSRCR